MSDFTNINFTSGYYKKYANKETPWVSGDTIEIYKHNYKNNPEELKKNGWLHKTISYKFNSLGFRCKEFLGEPSAMFLGCSNTMGIGLPLEEIWAEIISKELKLECANLSVGGGSSDTAFRLCLGYIDKIKPKIVIYNQPPIYRIELLNSSKFPINILLAEPKNYESEYSKEYSNDEGNSELNMLKNQFAIRYLCQSKNIKFLYFDNYMSSDFSPLAWKDLSRDLTHPGTTHNAEFAKFVLAQI